MRNQAGYSKSLQQEATVQLQQAYLQAALAHRERVQQVEGLQAHRNPLRQAGAKLPGLCLPRRCSCMVDLMSLDPSVLINQLFNKRGSVNVRFAPKATEVLRCRKLTRCADFVAKVVDGFRAE